MELERRADGGRCGEWALAGRGLTSDWLVDRGVGSAGVFDTRMAEFCAGGAEGASHTAGCQVSALMNDGTPAAVGITLKSKGHIAMHVPSAV